MIEDLIWLVVLITGITILVWPLNRMPIKEPFNYLAILVLLCLVVILRSFSLAM